MKRIIKECLFLFLLLGGVIFIAFQQVSDDVLPDDYTEYGQTISENRKVKILDGNL